MCYYCLSTKIKKKLQWHKMWHFSLLIVAIRFSLILLKILLSSYHCAVAKPPPHSGLWLLFLELVVPKDLFGLGFHYSPHIGCMRQILLFIALHSPPEFLLSPKTFSPNLTFILSLCLFYLVFTIHDHSILSYFLILKIPYIPKRLPSAPQW